MFGVLINADHKFARNDGRLIVTYNVNFVTYTIFVIIFECSTYKIVYLKPKRFVFFNVAIHQRLDVNTFSLGIANLNCGFG